jgi:TfoX/Sxy family transcriptional regulator of competence genes
MKSRAMKIQKQRDELEIDRSFVPIAAAFAKNRNVSGGMMMSSYGLKVKGKIFAMLVRGKFVGKLPKARVDQLVEQGAGRRFDPGHGRLMKEWIAIAGAEATWISLAREAYEFVNQAKPGKSQKR